MFNSLKDFLNQRDIQPKSKCDLPDKYGIVLSNVVMSRGKAEDSFELNIPDLKIQKRKLCCLVGKVGSGKVENNCECQSVFFALLCFRALSLKSLEEKEMSSQGKQ